MSFFDKFPYTNFHELNLDWIISQLATVKDSMLKAVESAKNAKVSEDKAKTSETNAKASEDKAKTSETNAKASEDNAKISETNAKSSEDNAKISETNAKSSEDRAKISETNAKASQDKAQQSSLNADNYLLNITRLTDHIDNEVLPELNRIDGEVKDAKTLAETSATNAKASENNAKISETNASASASSVASTVYYYDTGEIDCTQGETVHGLALTMRVILQNGFMYIYGTLAPDTTETTKPAGDSFSLKGGIFGLKYNALDIKAWIDEKLPNIDWDNLCGSCLVHGFGEVAVIDASTSQQLSSKTSLDIFGGIYYRTTQISSGEKLYSFSVRIEEMLRLFTDKSIKYDSSNCVARYTLIMPIKFK